MNRQASIQASIQSDWRLCVSFNQGIKVGVTVKNVSC